MKHTYFAKKLFLIGLLASNAAYAEQMFGCSDLASGVASVSAHELIIAMGDFGPTGEIQFYSPEGPGVRLEAGDATLRNFSAKKLNEYSNKYYYAVRSASGARYILNATRTESATRGVIWSGTIEAQTTGRESATYSITNCRTY